LSIFISGAAPVIFTVPRIGFTPAAGAAEVAGAEDGAEADAADEEGAASSFLVHAPSEITAASKNTDLFMVPREY
jgi:hypothetical protein